jgi:hypothetical protein
MSQSSQRIDVTRHDLSCAALHGGECGCAPETSTVKYERVCANCGGKLSNRRRPYCSYACRQDNRIRGKNLADRQASEQEYRARASEP